MSREPNPMAGEHFSTRHPFSRTDIEQVVEAVASESPIRRLLLRVTTAHRENSIHQWKLNQAAFWLVVAAILVAEIHQPTISRSLLYVWLLGCAANWLVRAVLYAWIFQAAPANVSHQLRLRLVPLFIMLISTGHWLWSVQIFLGPGLTPTALALCVGCVMLTIAALGNLLATPIAAGVFIGALWAGLSLRLIQISAMPWPSVFALNVCVAATLWLCIYMTVKQVRLHLERSDQVDLLLAELKRTNNELAGSNAQLEFMKNEAADKLEKRSSFFARASHDFLQRLYAMKLISLSVGEAPSPDRRARQALSCLAEEIRDLESCLGNFLDSARIEAMDEIVDFQEVSLMKLFQDVDLRFGDVAFSRSVRLQVRATWVRLQTDQWLLLRIIENLVFNALKFTRGGVLVAARKRGGAVVIEVWDQGPGIRQDHMSRIFEAYHQGPEASIDGPRGVGLGLAVVRRFADRLGYAVSVSSRLGRGSVFRVAIPSEAVLSA